MIVAVDVRYRDNDTALAAAVCFHRWTDAAPSNEVTAEIAHIAPYEPGAFFKRELPCILAVLKDRKPDLIVVDAYVDLDHDKPGLGRRVHDAVGIPVVGVAKTRYAGAAAVEVIRGVSIQPLFVTAAGMDVDEAAAAVRSMHGPHRMPTLLSRVDALSRTP